MRKNLDEFYVGYHERMPPATGVFFKKIIAGLLLLVAICAFVLASGQSAFYPSIFEFGVERTFEGIIVEQPYPVLLMQPSGANQNGDATSSRIYLVAFGKFGAAGRVAGMAGQKVRLRGSLIYRDGETMIEIADSPIERISGEITHGASFVKGPGAGVSMGELTAVGEIVDSKCFLGVMNPGNLKTHKACAIRCISGGIPPVFVVKTADGPAKYFLLVSEDGKAVNQQVLSMIAEPVKITGALEQHGDMYFLRADPANYVLQ